MFVVVLLYENEDPEVVGPFADEDECYRAAAQLSRKPNDWLPRVVVPLQDMLAEINLINS